MKPSGLITPPPADRPRILLYDIETTPLVGLSWEYYKTDLLTVLQDSFILCFSYKWWQQTEIGYVALPQNPSYRRNKRNDRWVVERLHCLFDQADCIVAHNGHRFDRRKANHRFSIHGLGPPSPYSEVDTLQESRRYFAPYSHRLNEIGRAHGLGEKKKHIGIPLWMGCMGGDPESWQTMEAYSRGDVQLLSDWYDLLLPWIGTPGQGGGGVNLALWNNDPNSDTCPKCGAKDTDSRKVFEHRGYHRTRFSRFHTMRCKDCGGWCRVPFREKGHATAI